MKRLERRNKRLKMKNMRLRHQVKNKELSTIPKEVPVEENPLEKVVDGEHIILPDTSNEAIEDQFPRRKKELRDDASSHSEESSDINPRHKRVEKHKEDEVRIHD